MRKLIEYPLGPIMGARHTTTKKVGVAKLPLSAKREKRKVLVLGTGRSGTNTTAEFLRQAGLKVKHEMTGPDGTVSHWFVVDSDWYPQRNGSKSNYHVGERRSDFDFEHTLHIVREPGKCIASMKDVFNAADFEFLVENRLLPADCMARGKLWIAASIYVNVNKACEEQAEFRWKLEEYAKAWPKLAKLLDMPKEMPVLPHRNARRKSPPVALAEIAAVDKLLAKEVAKVARRYGYSA